MSLGAKKARQTQARLPICMVVKKPRRYGRTTCWPHLRCILCCVCGRVLAAMQASDEESDSP